MSFAPTHIMVPVAIDPDEDFQLAEHAVLAACDIAEKFASKITLVHLTPMMTLGSNAGVDMSGKIYRSFLLVLEARLARGKVKLKELEEEATKRGITIDGRVVDSLENTATVIIETADEIKADLLVIGSHGRRGLSRLLFGSIAEKVVVKATMPILLLHPGTKA